MKISELYKILEGFNAWHSTNAQFDKFESGHFGIGNIYGDGLYFELTGADENFVEYVGNPDITKRYQIKAWLDLNDEEVLDANKSFNSQGIKLDLDDIRFLQQKGIIKDSLSYYLKLYIKIRTYDDVMNKIASLTHLLNYFLYTLKLELKSIFSKETVSFINSMLELNWDSITMPPSRKAQLKKDFFSQYEPSDVYKIFEEIQEKYYKVVLYALNNKFSVHEVLTVIHREDYPTIHKVLPQIKAIMYDSDSMMGTEEEMKKVANGGPVSFKRKYLILWDVKRAHIVSKRKRLKQRFHDEIEDEVIQDQLDYAQ